MPQFYHDFRVHLIEIWWWQANLQNHKNYILPYLYWPFHMLYSCKLELYFYQLLIHQVILLNITSCFDLICRSNENHWALLVAWILLDKMSCNYWLSICTHLCSGLSAHYFWLRWGLQRWKDMLCFWRGCCSVNSGGHCLSWQFGTHHLNSCGLYRGIY